MKKLILLFSDLSLFYFSLFAVLFIRYNGDIARESFSSHLYFFTIICLFWLIIFYIVGFYDLNFFKSKTEFAQKAAKVISFCFLVSILFFYFFRTPISPKTNLVFFSLIYLSFFILIRIRLVRLLKLNSLWKNVVFLGSQRQYDELISYLSQNRHIGYKVEYFYQPESASGTKVETKGLVALIKKKKIGTIIAAVGKGVNDQLVAELYRAFSLDLEFISLAKLYERETSKVSLGDLDELWFLDNLARGEKRTYEVLKRTFDITMSLILLILLAPLAVVVSLLIKFTSKGPIFFRQNRVGKDGEVFDAVKFRSMILGAEKNGPQWAISNDPRTTRFGKILRKTHLDEIPQLYNVIMGNMSLVGPRPERPEFVKELETKIPFYPVRHLVQPGITGWAQILFPYGASVEDAKEKFQYELYYIKNRSLSLDAKILLKTVYSVIRGDGR